MSRRLLDLCCSAGGASVGYARAGFEVVGVDIEQQPRYPFEFVHADALDVLSDRSFLSGFDAVHVSWPCQSYSITSYLPGAKGAARLIDEGRELLEACGLPWVVENVVGAPMRGPIMLCGSTFGLRAADVDGVILELRRHRLFESNVFLLGTGGCDHRRHPIGSVFGSGGGATPAFRDDPARDSGYVPAVRVIRELMGIDWMTKAELSQAIPPAYTEFIGEQLLIELQTTHSPATTSIAGRNAPEGAGGQAPTFDAVMTPRGSESVPVPPENLGLEGLHRSATMARRDGASPTTDSPPGGTRT